MEAILQYVLYLVILVALAIPLGKYIGKIMDGETVFLSKILRPVERGIYKILHVKEDEEMGWKRYAGSVFMFSILALAVLMLMHMFQGFLPWNPQGQKGISWDLAFNNAVSFITNTNWQAYSGESTLSYFTQAMGLTVQNFLSAAVGIAVLFALIRGFIKVKAKGLGSFWVDLTRITLYILIPLCIVSSLILVSQGVVQNFHSYETVDLVEPITLEDGTEVTQQIVPQGPAASQIAIKQAGTNGGGFFGVNSAHPLENPTALANMVEMLSLLLIPAALCFTFGRQVKNKKQGFAIFMAMFLMLAVSLGVIGYNEQMGTPQLANEQTVDLGTNDQPEGKESRFGIASSATWAAFTTAASNGSVNSMHDSYTPIGGMVPMLLMQLGEVVFGGTGCGLYGMLGFAILAVFIAGLMVGRTPEFLGKKIEPYEMKMAVLVCLATPVAILVGSGIATLLPQVADSLNNPGAHGFSEVLYAYSSAGGNNGSAFAGFGADTVFLNVSLGLVMLFVRFLPIFAVLAIAGSLVKKKKVAQTAGTLSTTNAMFVFLLILVVLIVGALSFFPALSLGPIAEFLQM
jgi:K+-transporting ATPase ATPase A chain